MPDKSTDQRILDLEKTLAGYTKCLDLLNEGLESVCQDREDLKRRVRTLEIELGRTRAIMAAT